MNINERNVDLVTMLEDAAQSDRFLEMAKKAIKQCSDELSKNLSPIQLDRLQGLLPDEGLSQPTHPPIYPYKHFKFGFVPYYKSQNERRFKIVYSFSITIDDFKRLTSTSESDINQIKELITTIQNDYFTVVKLEIINNEECFTLEQHHFCESNDNKILDEICKKAEISYQNKINNSEKK